VPPRCVESVATLYGATGLSLVECGSAGPGDDIEASIEYGVLRPHIVSTRKFTKESQVCRVSSCADDAVEFLVLGYSVVPFPMIARRNSARHPRPTSPLLVAECAEGHRFSVRSSMNPASYCLFPRSFHFSSIATFLLGTLVCCGRISLRDDRSIREETANETNGSPRSRIEDRKR